MKQFVYKLLVVVFLINISPLKELMKAPLLLLHYWEHLEEFPEMTLQQFYVMHYVVDIHFDEDYEHDRQLPFKTFEYSPIPAFLVFKTQDVSEPQSMTFLQRNMKVNQIYRLLVKDPHIQGIFHPPQNV
jgi:hypothetical protein